MLLMVFFVVSMNIFMSKGTRDTAVICTIKLFIENNIHFEGILGFVPIAKTVIIYIVIPFYLHFLYKL